MNRVSQRPAAGDCILDHEHNIGDSFRFRFAVSRPMQFRDMLLVSVVVSGSGPLRLARQWPLVTYERSDRGFVL